MDGGSISPLVSSAFSPGLQSQLFPNAPADEPKSPLSSRPQHLGAIAQGPSTFLKGRGLGNLCQAGVRGEAGPTARTAPPLLPLEASSLQWRVHRRAQGCKHWSACPPTRHLLGILSQHPWPWKLCGEAGRAPPVPSSCHSPPVSIRWQPPSLPLALTKNSSGRSSFIL